MLYFFIFSLILVSAFTLLWLLEISKNVEHNNIYREKINNEIEKIIKLFSTGFIPVFIVHLIFLIPIFFVKKSFFYFTLYGNLLSFVFVVIDLLLNYYLSYIIYPYIINKRNYEIEKIYVLVKIFIYILLNFFFYLIYLRFSDKLDYGIMYCGMIFSFFVFYIYLSNKFKDLFIFVNHSYFSLVFISAVLLFMKFSSPKEIIFYMSYMLCFFIFYLINIIFKDKIKIKHENIKNNFILFIGVFTILILLSFKIYQNLFISLSFIILFSFSILIKEMELDDIYKNIVIFILLIGILFVSRFFINFLVDFTYEKFALFLLVFLIPSFYLSLKKVEFYHLCNFNNNLMNEKKDVTLNFSDFKIPFTVIVFVFYFTFVKIYNLLNVYYGYNDTIDIFVVIFPILMFYFFEVFSSTIINKIDNFVLNLIFNISVVVFAFSFVIVSISYLSNINYSNLFISFVLYSILNLFLSKKYYQYLVSLIYLVGLYLVIYV